MRDLAKLESKQNSMSGKVQVALKMNVMWLEVSLHCFEFLIKLFSQEYEELFCVDIREDSMFVTWSISKGSADHITRTISHEVLASVGIISLQVGTKVVFSNDLLQDYLTFDTALLRAVQSNGPLPAIALLLAVGGDPSILTRLPNRSKNDICTALLFTASKYGHTSIVSTLLNYGANPNLADQGGMTPLMIASENGHGEVVQVLLESAVSTNTQSEDGRTAIYIASHNGHSSIVSALLNNGADPNLAANDGSKPLMIASQRGHNDIIKILHRWNVKIDSQTKDIGTCTKKKWLLIISLLSGVLGILLGGIVTYFLLSYLAFGQTPLMTSSVSGYVYITQILLAMNVSTNYQHKNGKTAIYFACQMGHSTVVSTLLKNGADPNLADSHGWTPLMIASHNGHEDVVHVLREWKVPINDHMKDGTTAIFVASSNGQFSVVSTLLNGGADPKLTNNDGWTPLMVASQNGHNDVVELLLKWNIPTNAQNKKGETAIYIASYSNHSSVVSTLVSKGADPNQVDNDGWTPLMAASQNGHDGVVKILLKKYTEQRGRNGNISC